MECERRKNLLRLLESFETDDRLCHGDFHALNLMWTSQGMQIIDWVDAGSGSALADVCRSYLLYLLYRPEIAQLYLEIYCSKANVAKQRVLMWLPVIAGARLSETVKGQDTATLLKMAQGNPG
ncbi:MAG: phosphotransferase [Eubacteriales bacterium]|nr:phosphotransferase [Eubacteriales bacterium]